MSDINVLNKVTPEYNRQALFSILQTMQQKINELSNHQYGQLAISSNSTTIAITAAVDPTLLTNSDYIQVTGVWNPIPHGLNNGVTQQTNSVTVARNGVYRISMWANVTSSVGATIMAFKFATNGVITLIRRPEVRIDNINDVENVSAYGFAEFTAGDVVTLWIASTKTADITLQDLVFSLDEMKCTL
jgi:hypothetical protein